MNRAAGKTPGSVLVVGAGIAGVLVAWELKRKGFLVEMVDDARPGAASPVAAGLVNPIAGMRLTPASNLEQLLASANRVYAAWEDVLGVRVWHPMSIKREFRSQWEWQQWCRRATEPLCRAHTVEECAPDSEAFGHIVTRGGGWVDYSLLGTVLKKAGIPVRRETISYEQLTRATEGAFIWGGELWQAVVFCEGYNRNNPWLKNLQWNAAAGDILTVRLPGWDETRIRMKGFFTIPLGGGIFRAGATYDWNNLEVMPSASGACEILNGLREWMGIEPEMMEHRRGVRPILKNKKSVLGALQELPGAFVLNGLGSKGALWGPEAAANLCAMICGDASVQTASAEPVQAVKLTRSVHEKVRTWLRPDDWVIDATAGNGHDTHFLATQISDMGRVAAFDVQARAIEGTQRRLHQAGLLKRVLVLHCAHEDFAQHLPQVWRGKVSLAVMNLGYLPGSDKMCVTEKTSTLRFLNGLIGWLAPRAAISIIAYRGHSGGTEEHAAVADWMEGVLCHGGWELERVIGSGGDLSPEWFWLVRAEVGSR